MKISQIIVLLFVTVVFSPIIITAQEDITLVVYGEPGPDCTNPDNSWEFCLYSRAVTDLWYEMHPNIHIEWVNAGWDAELYQAVQGAIDAGDPPDITIGETFLPSMMRDGQLLPLELDPDIRTNIVPGTVAYVTDENDTLYGVPIFTGVFALELNPDVFYAAGLVPEGVSLGTWGDVLAVSQLIAENGDDDYYGHTILGPTNLPAAALFRFAPYLYMTGADFCNMPTCDVPTLNDPGGVPAYRYFRELYTTASPEITFNGEEGYVLSQLFSGASAMQTAGSWHISWAAGSGCPDCRYLPLPVPQSSPIVEPTNVVVGNAIYAGLSSTEHPEEVRMFLEFLASDDLQNLVLWTGVGGRLPVTYTALETIIDVSEGERLDRLPSFWTEELNNELEDAIPFAEDYIPFVEQLMTSDLRTLPFWDVEMSMLWNDMFEEILTSDRPVQEILDEYQKEAEVLMSADGN